MGTHLGGTGQSVTGLTDANVQAQFADVQIAHHILGLVRLRLLGLRSSNGLSGGLCVEGCTEETRGLDFIVSRYHWRRIVATPRPKLGAVLSHICRSLVAQNTWPGGCPAANDNIAPHTIRCTHTHTEHNSVFEAGAAGQNRHNTGKYGPQTEGDGVTTALGGSDAPRALQIPGCSTIFPRTGTETQHIPTFLFAKKSLAEKEIHVQRTVFFLTARQRSCGHAGQLSFSGCE